MALEFRLSGRSTRMFHASLQGKDCWLSCTKAPMRWP
eukprot:CAMPEP_0197894476 /NCGR_PEP_ID=MMETSP1439-20131203/35678_1 /TAXON_ID=66791 /ORGANISM="Gonyaulax spinifera, Strain CCMP409" /LENGTH=36 /DNA_ID= /DNA_START= /DNA_END= /DNA_ORIENTATION=